MRTVKTSENIIAASRGLPADNSCRWESENIYSSAWAYYEDLLSDIDSAVSSVEMAVYIFSLDDTGQRVLATLASAAQRRSGSDS